MNILIISDWGGALALGLRFQREGHVVRLWIKDPDYKNVGDGMIEKISDYHTSTDWAEFVLCDDVGLDAIAREMRDASKVVWGATEYSERLELDRGFAQSEFSSAGLTILPEHSFESLAEGIQYVTDTPGRYVFKPNGTAQEDKILTYVGRSKDGSDLIALMRHLERAKHGKLQSFELQKFESGVEIGISGFYNGQRFVEPIEVTFEHKKLMTGDIGPATFEMGTTLFWTTRQSKLYRETIQKMEERLRGYVGYFDINCICDRETIYPLEATCRFGYPTIFVNMEGLAGELGETMFRIARGEDASFETAAPIAVCVVIASPPWPYPSKEVFKQYGENNLVIVHRAEGTELPKGIYPAEIRFADGDFYTAGYTGFTAIAAAAAATIEEARGEAYNRVGLVNISNMMFRTDIGATWHSDMASLREWGWLNEA